MPKLFRLSLISAVAAIILYFAVALIMIFRPEPTFATGPFPTAATATTADFTPQQFTMRDGTTLFARHFSAESELTILLLHGVTADSAAFNTSASMLRETTGANLIALDLRGHGRSGGTAGDVDYIGQYQDDVADVISAIRQERPHGRLILAGHSMGGGIALQFAQLTDRPAVDGYLLFAPHLGSNAPTMPQPDPQTADLAATYSQLHVSRLIGLIMLNSVGIKSLNYLDTLFFNLTDATTHTYSFRALANSSPQEHGPALAAVDAPLLVLVGRNDEAFVAEQYPAAVAEFTTGEVHILAGENHNSIIASTAAMPLIATWLDTLE